MDEREELKETVELLEDVRLLWYAFEELKEIRDRLDPDRIQELIWKIGNQLGEF